MTRSLIPFWTLSKRMKPQVSLSRWLINAPRVVKSLRHVWCGQWYRAC